MRIGISGEGVERAKVANYFVLQLIGFIVVSNIRYIGWISRNAAITRRKRG